MEKDLPFSMCAEMSVGRGEGLTKGTESRSRGRRGSYPSWRKWLRVRLFRQLSKEARGTGKLMSSKTTLLKCIAELNVYQAGKILLNGK